MSEKEKKKKEKTSETSGAVDEKSKVKKKVVRKFTIEAFGTQITVNVDKSMTYKELREEIKSQATKPIKEKKIPHELFVVNKDDNSKFSLSLSLVFRVRLLCVVSGFS